jgi:ribosomal protein S21
MAFVISKEKESFENLLRRFKKKVLDEHIISDYREKTYFMKPSEKRRKYEKERIKKIKKANSRRATEIKGDIHP